MARLLSCANIIVLDLETLYAAQDCAGCLGPHGAGAGCESYAPIGWDNVGALGLSVGGYYDYEDGLVHWFDMASLGMVMADLMARRPLVVTYNGKHFDLRLMHALGAGILHDAASSAAWSSLAEESYDVLAEIWALDPESKFTKGLNSLDAVARANGLGGKLIHDGGLLAPVLWRTGRYAEVLNYCQHDILLTKALFEMVVAGRPLRRSDGSALTLRCPSSLFDDDLPF